MKITVQGLPIDDLDPRKVNEFINKSIKKSILTLEGTAKREAPVDTGFLRNAFRSRFTDLRGVLVNTAEYAPWIHDGRKGGKAPPLEHIATWARRKGVSAPPFLMARSIARKGTKGNPFMTRTVEKEEGNIEAIFKSEFKKLYS